MDEGYGEETRMNELAKHWLRFHLSGGIGVLFIAIGGSYLGHLPWWGYAIMIPVGILGMIYQTFHIACENRWINPAKIFGDKPE